MDPAERSTGDLKLSIALSTQDGEAHLSEQLETIRSQSRQPDELVVVDGGSTDGTTRILRRFADRVGFPVDVHPGEPVGASANFARAIALCTGDHIALGDQRDTWMVERLEAGERALIDRPDVMLAFSDAHLINESGVVLRGRLWRTIGFGQQELRTMRCDPLAAMLRRPPVAGSTISFRREVRDIALPFPPDLGLPHDAWLALCAAAVGTIAPLPTPLAACRVRSRLALVWSRFRRGSGGPFLRRTAGDRAHGCDRRLLVVRDQAALLQVRLVQRRAGSPEVLATLERFAEFCEFRDALPPLRARLAAVLRRARAGDYHRFADGWPGALTDLLRW
jgi:hypothetical protein